MRPLRINMQARVLLLIIGIGCCIAQPHLTDDRIKLQPKHAVIFFKSEDSTTDNSLSVTTDSYDLSFVSKTDSPELIILSVTEVDISPSQADASIVKTLEIDTEHTISESSEQIADNEPSRISYRERRKNKHLNAANLRMNRNAPVPNLIAHTEAATEFSQDSQNQDDEEGFENDMSQGLLFLPSHRTDQKTTQDNDQLSNVTPPGSSLFGVFLTAFLVLFGVFVWILIYNRRLDIDYYNRGARSYQCVDKDVFLDSSENELFRR